MAQDLYFDKRGQLDFKTSYQVADHVDALLEALNITDEPLRFCGRLAENEIYAWNVVGGVQVSADGRALFPGGSGSRISSLAP